MVSYETTPDPNIIIEIRIVRSEIHLDKLRERIANIQIEIDSIPSPYEYPEGASQEIIDLIDEQNGQIPDTTDLEAEIIIKQALLVDLEGL